MDQQIDPAEKSFQLAHFILGDRSTAIDVLTDALEKWKLQCRHERKRLFWRDKHPERMIRRISRTDIDALQWLVMSEAECREKHQEHSGRQSLHDMIVHYVKFLICATAPISSFYVDVAVNRLLYSYHTSEVQTAYETLTRRRIETSQYRRVKAVLISKIRQRFGELAEITTSPRGEIRLTSFADQEQWISLVDKCLRFFTPWSTSDFCARFAPGSSGKTNAGRQPHHLMETDQDNAEIKRCHIFIEPACSRCLMDSLELDPPERRMALPQLFAGSQDGGQDGKGNNGNRDTSQLSPDERRSIGRKLRSRDVRRQELCPRSVRFVADGTEMAQVDLRKNMDLQLGIEHGSKAIEIRTEDEFGDLLLDTIPITYTHGLIKPSNRIAYLGNGLVRFSITPQTEFSKSSCHATLDAKFEPMLRHGLSGWAQIARTLKDDRPERRPKMQWLPCA